MPKGISDDLCGHYKGLLAGSVPESILQPTIGKLESMTPDTLIEYQKELGEILTHALAGDLADYETQRLPEEGSKRTFQINLKHENGIIRSQDPFVDFIIRMDFASTDTQSCWAGLTNLNSFKYRLDSRPSRSEKRKAVKAIRHEFSVDRKLKAEWTAFLEDFLPRLLKTLPEIQDEYMPYWAFPASNKKLVQIDEGGGYKPLSRDQFGLYELKGALRVPSIQKLAFLDPSEFITRIKEGRKVSIKWTSEFQTPHDKDIMGMLRISPKNGSKPRIVVVMSILTASLSFPLGKRLKHINSNWNIQFVDNQDLGKSQIGAFMYFNMIPNCGHSGFQKVRSFDQSSFTDNFSYTDVQRPILQVLSKNNYISDFDIQIMDAICYGLYDMTSIQDNLLSPYGTGTPMGSFPSFPLASLGNGLLACFAYYKVKGKYPSLAKDYIPGIWIVGDDCVIADLKVAQKYEELCNEIGLIVNPTKSITSERCAEFCSTFITKDGIFKKKKIPEFVNYEALKEPIEYYGLENFNKAFPEYSEISQKIVQIPKPFGLGPEIDQSKDYQFDNFKAGLKAKLQIKEVQKAFPSVAETAHSVMIGFNRARIDVEGTGFPSFPVSYSIIESELEELENSPDKKRLLKFEESLMKDLDFIDKNILSLRCWQSDKVQDAAGHVNNITRIFKSKYPEAFVNRKPIEILSLVKEGGEPESYKPSDLKQIIDIKDDEDQLSL